MKKYRKIANAFLAGAFLIMLLFSSGHAQAAAKLELVNLRSEPVMSVYRTWDADKNTDFTQGWITINPDSTVIITLENYGDWEQVVWLFAISPTKIWQGDPSTNLSDPDISFMVNNKGDFKYWDKKVAVSRPQDWEMVVAFAIKERARASFRYTFE